MASRLRSTLSWVSQDRDENKELDTNEMYFFGIIAGCAYESVGIPRFTTCWQNFQLLDPVFVNFTIEHKLSDEYSLVLKNTTKKEIYIGFRGTDPLDAFDLISDVGIVFHFAQATPRFTAAEEVLNKVRGEFGYTYKYYICGHSLGGAIAIKLGNTYPWVSNVYAYNPGGVYINFNTPENERKLKTYHVIGDMISLTSNAHLNSYRIPRSPHLSAHSSLNFIPHTKQTRIAPVVSEPVDVRNEELMNWAII